MKSFVFVLFSLLLTSLNLYATEFSIRGDKFSDLSEKYANLTIENCNYSITHETNNVSIVIELALPNKNATGLIVLQNPGQLPSKKHPSKTYIYNGKTFNNPPESAPRNFTAVAVQKNAFDGTSFLPSDEKASCVSKLKLTNNILSGEVKCSNLTSDDSPEERFEFHAKQISCSKK